MKILTMMLTMIYRSGTLKCIYCGTKYELLCPNNCDIIDRFITHKEAKVQRALGLLH